MGIESTPQQSNWVLPSPAGGSVHPPPHPTLNSPTHPKRLDGSIAMMRSILHERRRRHWWYAEAEEESESESESESETEEEEEEEDMDDAKREMIKSTIKRNDAEFRRTALARMERWVKLCEVSKDSDCLVAPPMQMLDYPAHFQRAWGWDRILPCPDAAPWSRYKKYLMEYYSHNQVESSADGDADDSGNGLADLAYKCIEMERHLMFLWNKKSGDFPADGDKIKRVSNRIIIGAQEVINSLKVVEYPAATVSLKCVIAEADLICDCLLWEADISIYCIRMSNEIRQCALSFMIYEGPEHIVAMAAMMGVMKEAKLICQVLQDKKEYISKSLSIRGSALGVIFSICHDCCAVEGSTGGSTSGECTFKQSDGKNFPEKKPVKRSNLVERNNISQKTKDECNHNSCSVTDIVEQDSLLDTNGTNSTKKNTNIGSETEEVREDSTTGSSNAGEFILDGSADWDNSEEKLFENDKEDEREKIHENSKAVEEKDNTIGRSKSANRNCSQEKPVRKDKEGKDDINQITENHYMKDVKKEDWLLGMDVDNQSTEIGSETGSTVREIQWKGMRSES